METLHKTEGDSLAEKLFFGNLQKTLDKLFFVVYNLSLIHI